MLEVFLVDAAAAFAVIVNLLWLCLFPFFLTKKSCVSCPKFQQQNATLSMKPNLLEAGKNRSLVAILRFPYDEFVTEILGTAGRLRGGAAIKQSTLPKVTMRSVNDWL